MLAGERKGNGVRIAYFDCMSGISGDMLLGALVDSGVDVATIQAGIDSLGLRGPERQIESRMHAYWQARVDGDIETMAASSRRRPRRRAAQ